MERLSVKDAGTKRQRASSPQRFFRILAGPCADGTEMTVQPIHEARSGERLTLGSPAAWARDLVVAALVGAWIGVLGPFGNYVEGPLKTRIAFDLVLAMISVAAFGVTIRVGVGTGRQIGVSPWISAPVSIAATCLPLSAVVAWVATSFFPRLKDVLSPVDWFVEALVVALPIIGGYACLLHLLSRRPQVVPARIEAAAESVSLKEPPAPRLAKRLPSALGMDIQALTVEDHYVRIHTATGSHLTLMRLSDAIAEMDGVEGLRVHRSWWIARKAVRSVHLNGRGGRLILHDGLQAPVARSALAAVRAAGWTRGA